VEVVGRIGYGALVVADHTSCCLMAEVVEVWGWVGVGLMLPLAQHWLLLLLAKDVNNIL
jgi:hypothetical protein